MDAKDDRPVGLTKDTGWQIGLRKTLPIRLEEAWMLLTSQPGVRLWLGETEDLKFEQGATYQTTDGSRGEIRVFRPDSHLRITRQPGGWPRASTIQVRVLPKGDKTVVAFHEEHLPGPQEREARRAHYRAAVDAIARLIGS